MNFVDDALTRLYQHTGEFFIVVRPDGIIVVEPPDEDVGRESVLRVFMTVAEAIAYKDQEPEASITSVRRTTIVGLWSLLPDINNLSLKQYGVPVRVDVSICTKNSNVVSIDTLHSVYSLRS